MRPRLHIKTVMLAVALAALSCYAYRWLPYLQRLPPALAIVGIGLVGPLVGACLVGSLRKDPLSGSVEGGILGGLAEALILVLAQVVLAGPSVAAAILAFVAFLFFATIGTFAGMLVGLLVGIVLLYISEGRPPRS